MDKLKQIFIIVCISLLGVAMVGCTPEQIAAFKSATPAQQAAIIEGLKAYHAEKNAVRGNPSAWETSKLASIRACESGGNYRITNPSGKYRGAYQFGFPTWRSVGGVGDPAAASKVEQDYRALVLLRSRGTQPWPHCGR